MGLRRLAREAVWPATGGHWANQAGGALENFGNFSPDTAATVAAVDVIFITPDVDSPVILVVLSADLFTNVAATEHGYFGLYRDGSLVTGSRKRVHSGGPNNKRRIIYDHIITDLPSNTEVTLVWMWEGTNADDIRCNQSDDGFSRALMEVYDVTLAAAAGSGAVLARGRGNNSRRDRTKGRRTYLETA